MRNLFGEQRPWRRPVPAGRDAHHDVRAVRTDATPRRADLQGSVAELVCQIAALRFE